jgi:histidinol-phosphate/aromatic aminotransferase/cobyric acid decarboxylase-like protein
MEAVGVKPVALTVRRWPNHDVDADLVLRELGGQVEVVLATSPLNPPVT